MLSPLAAHAQVYEITPAGDMMVRDGGGAVRWHDAQDRPRVVHAPAPAALPAGTAMTDAVTQAAARHGISPDLLEALVWQESRWHSDAVSPKGARGLTQLMPATAQALGVDAGDPLANLDGGAHYLRLMLDRFGDVELALAAYNAGPRRVERAGSIPPLSATPFLGHRC